MTKTFAQDYITSSNGKYTVHGHNGRSFGTYASEGEAKKRLEQIEWFKGHSKDMAPEEFDQLKALFGEFIDEEKQEPEHSRDSGSKIGGGVVLQAPSGRVLLLKRGGVEGKDNYVGHWGLPGGKAEDGEGPEDAAGREAFEETGYAFGAMHQNLGTVKTPNGFDFTTYLHRTKDEFTPKLDGEHTAHRWATLDDLPEPMHPGVAETLGKLKVAGGAKDSVAMDKDSIRTLDDAGRMHVEAVHISKACVNPYYGSEIPGWEALGLEPDRVYQMFRDPVELALAADTFNGIQLLIVHTPVSVEDHRPNEIVGCTGTTAKFTEPYLDNELVIWTQSGIDAVESGLQKELSCGYGYVPVMEPGAYEGVRYDGRMTVIKGNHVALVEKGRAGPEVVIGDQALKQKEDTQMTKPLSRTAARVQAALVAHYLPKIALDSQLKFSTAIGTSLGYLGTTEKITRAALKKPNFRQAIIKMAKDAAEPMMTPEAKKAGASPDDVIMRVLDMVEGQVEGEAPAMEEDEGSSLEGNSATPAGGPARKQMMDAMLKTGMDEKTAGGICDMFPWQKEGAEKKEGEDDEGEDEETEEEKAAKAAKDKAKDEEKEKAMDAQITAGIAAGLEVERKRNREAVEARQFVEPWVGKVSLAHDSAEAIYRTALSMIGVDHAAVKDHTALRLILQAQRKPHERHQTEELLATDAAPAGKSFADMFPGADRIENAA